MPTEVAVLYKHSSAVRVLVAYYSNVLGEGRVGGVGGGKGRGAHNSLKLLTVYSVPSKRYTKSLVEYLASRVSHLR